MLVTSFFFGPCTFVRACEGTRASRLVIVPCTTLRRIRILIIIRVAKGCRHNSPSHLSLTMRGLLASRQYMEIINIIRMALCIALHLRGRPCIALHLRGRPTLDWSVPASAIHLGSSNEALHSTLQCNHQP